MASWRNLRSHGKIPIAKFHVEFRRRSIHSQDFISYDIHGRYLRSHIHFLHHKPLPDHFAEIRRVPPETNREIQSLHVVCFLHFLWQCKKRFSAHSLLAS